MIDTSRQPTTDDVLKTIDDKIGGFYVKGDDIPDTLRVAAIKYGIDWIEGYNNALEAGTEFDEDYNPLMNLGDLIDGFIDGWQARDAQQKHDNN